MKWIPFGMILPLAVFLASGPVLAGPASLRQKVDAMLEQMTLQEKIGQMTLIDKVFLDDPEDIVRYGIGSILAGGDSRPLDDSAKGWADMTDGYQKIALRSRLKIPILFGIDAVHGHAKVRNATVFPHNIGMGCTGDLDIVRKAARVTAEEMVATGFRWTYAPCVAVVRDERWGRTYEGFGETTEIVTRMGEAVVKGLQNGNLDRPDSVLSCAKHFVGDGGTTLGANEGDTVMAEKELRRLFFPPYVQAIMAGSRTVMISFSSWNGQRMHANRTLITDVLKKELSFDGFVVSDWGAVQKLPGDYRDQVAAAVNAGIDMIMVPSDYKKFSAALQELVRDGRVPLARVNDAVKRILKVKMETGLFERPYAQRDRLGRIGSDSHRRVAREAVRKSLVLLKNENRFLPLRKNLRTLVVAGKSSDDVGVQCGGWTLSWQGVIGDVTKGTTVYRAVRRAVSATTRVILSPDGKNLPKADAAIVVVGEYPYAETAGDRAELYLDRDDIATIDEIRKKGIPMAVVLISGRPLVLTDELHKMNALVAAWLPGTEGDGIADVLFGDYAPTGRLTYTWPKTMEQIPINSGDMKYEPLFPHGFGLTYPKAEGK